MLALSYYSSVFSVTGMCLYVLLVILPLYKCHFISMLYCFILFHCLTCICALQLILPACKRRMPFAVLQMSKQMAVLCGMPTIQYSARSACQSVRVI